MNNCSSDDEVHHFSRSVPDCAWCDLDLHDLIFLVSQSWSENLALFVDVYLLWVTCFFIPNVPKVLRYLAMQLAGALGFMYFFARPGKNYFGRVLFGIDIWCGYWVVGQYNYQDWPS